MTIELNIGVTLALTLCAIAFFATICVVSRVAKKKDDPQ